MGRLRNWVGGIRSAVTMRCGMGCTVVPADHATDHAAGHAADHAR